MHYYLSSSVLRHNPTGGYAITMQTDYRRAWQHRTLYFPYYTAIQL